jgi:CubicO group peptidase (beta-lactamase class C family)
MISHSRKCISTVQWLPLDDSNNDVNEIIHSMRYLKPMAELRQTNQYCNFHYTVLSHIVTVLSGMPHTKFIQQRIFDPLNLTATLDHLAPERSAKRVPSHFRQGVDPVKCQKIWNETNTMDVSCIGEPVTVSWFMKGSDDSIAGVTGVFMSISDGVCYGDFWLLTSRSSG